MNLCLACREIGPESHSGLARATCDLAEALAKQGHSIHLLTHAPNAPTPVLREVSVEVLAIPPTAGGANNPEPESMRHAAAVYRQVTRIHERVQPVDAVLAPLWSSEGAVCVLDDRFPTIVSCMTSLRTLTEIDGRHLRLPDIAKRLAIEHEALARSRYLHGLTDSTLRKTIEDHHLSPGATAVIGRGLRDRGRAIEAHARHDRVARVLFVGRLERRKGVDTLLAAARALVADGVAVEFTLAGPGVDPSFRDSFEREAAERPLLRAAVRFAGPVSDAELNRLYVDSDIVCAPSRYESHGVVLMEAMMFAKPIVTCDAGGISEVVTAQRNALVVPPDDPLALAETLRRLAASTELREMLGACARETYEARFDIGSVARQMASFIERVISIHPRARSDVTGRLAALLTDALELTPDDARVLGGELLDPPASAWRAWARECAETALQPERDQTVRLREVVAAREETIAVLLMRDQTLSRIEQGGWWRLRGRLLPLLRLAGQLRTVARRGVGYARPLRGRAEAARSWLARRGITSRQGQP